MNQFEQAKQAFEATPIPEELNERVEAGIRQGQANYRKENRSHGFRRSATAVAACLAVLVGTLNVSPTVAKAAAEVPLLGGLFQVLTVRSFEAEEDGLSYEVEIPGVESESDFTEAVNAQIQSRVDAHLAECEQLWKEYEEAFLSTGGTAEEWAQREMNVSVSYEILSQTDTTVSFRVDQTQDVFGAYNEQYFYNLDLMAGRDLTLADVLGEDWVKVCNTAIQAVIDESLADPETNIYFTAEEGGFTTVDESTAFYLTADGTPVVVFPQHTVAYGYVGAVEFPIAR